MIFLLKIQRNIFFFCFLFFIIFLSFCFLILFVSSFFSSFVSFCFLLLFSPGPGFKYLSIQLKSCCVPVLVIRFNEIENNTNQINCTLWIWTSVLSRITDKRTACSVTRIQRSWFAIDYSRGVSFYLESENSISRGDLSQLLWLLLVFCWQNNLI